MKNYRFRETIVNHFRVVHRVNFNVYANQMLDRLYTFDISDEYQSTGYILLKKLLEQKEKVVTRHKLNFLHIILREYIFENWCIIKHFKKII